MPRIVRRLAATVLTTGLAMGLMIGVLGLATATAADPDEGGRLARLWCTSCHIVVPGTDGSDAAPTFQTIANDPKVTEGGLRVWLADPHPPMPKFDLTRAETDAIIAYIESLKRQ